ncbi:hypothetical protein [Sphingobium sp. EP60837]|uniref:hypothetical protein n=1 Tax=Sphingobium sp. EP60837 TaxID=1855519 RepID=UPI0007DDD73B|nr:hypothetical protein [Sphingobium sp. EP60837]ANI79198.1 hypothetical protein EP837_02804 [Sphingobium sp. EP60837]
MSGIFSASPSTGPARLMIGGLLQSTLAGILALIAPDPSATMLRAAVGIMLLTAIGAFLFAIKSEQADLPPFGRRSHV